MVEGSGEVEQPLVGGGTQGIVRVGATVRRPWRPLTATVQSCLAHLRAQGFTGAPEAVRRDAAFARMVQGGALERNARAEAWLREQGPRLRAALSR